MIRKLSLLVIFMSTLFVFGQKSASKGGKIKLGDSFISVVQSPHQGSPIQFLNLHENEQTSIQALQRCTSHKLNYFYLSHSGDRRIKFSINEQQFSVDPNRIFTPSGRKKTLNDGGKFTKDAESEVAQFAEKLTTRLKDKSVIIAVHNNTEENYSIKSYAPRGSEAANTKSVYINDNMDPDDFVYTTDLTVYDALSAQGINVILQDNSTMVDDGSLSIYCGLNDIRYINIETQHGHLEEQLRLMEIILEILNQ